MMTLETGIKIFPVIVPDYIDIKWPENVDSKIGKAIENVLTAEADEMEKGEKVHCSKTHGSEKKRHANGTILCDHKYREVKNRILNRIQQQHDDGQFD